MRLEKTGYIEHYGQCALTSRWLAVPLRQLGTKNRYRILSSLRLVWLGFRVPALVISPWAKHALIDHTQYELASMLRLAEENFNLPILGVKDLKTNDMMNSFDFNQTPQLTLIEPANFVGPAPETSTTTHTTAISEVNPAQTPLFVVLVIATVSTYVVGWRRKLLRV